MGGAVGRWSPEGGGWAPELVVFEDATLHVLAELLVQPERFDAADPPLKGSKR